MVKLNQVKKAKAEELSKQTAAGSQEEAQEAREKAQVSHREFPTIFIFLLRADINKYCNAGRNMLVS
jgi:uncharacterized membrane-anchored protein